MNINQSDFIHGDAFKSIADEVLDHNKLQMSIQNSPRIIFSHVDYIFLFIEKYLPYIKYPFVFISNKGDTPLFQDRYKLLLDSKYLIRWYGTNCNKIHEKIVAIPIGIGDKQYAHGNKEELIQVINNTSITKCDKLYCNFTIKNNTKDRQECFNQISKLPFVTIQMNNISFKDYLIQTKIHRWSVSPPGNGVDCHRTWESIYVGTIPIVIDNIEFSQFSELPIIKVKNYENLSIEFLKEKSDNLLNVLDKSRFSYWKNRILGEF